MFIITMGVFLLVGFVGYSNPVSASTNNMKSARGNDIISGDSYQIMISWGSTSSKDVYLTGDEFKSTKDMGAGTNFQIISADNKLGTPIPEGAPFIIRSDSSGMFWNWTANMTRAYVWLGDSAIDHTDHVTYQEGSTFTVDNLELKEGYNSYALGAGGVYALGYDWNNSISTDSGNYWATEFLFFD